MDTVAKTPVRVRGKRDATKAEKWNHGKRQVSVESSASSMRSSSVPSDSTTSKMGRQRKRRRREPHLSRLEQLPTEITQLIFVFSANLDLPLVSRSLTTQLAGRQLYYEVTDKVMAPFTRGQEKPSKTEYQTASRVMNSRFFTWRFFQSWLERQVDAFDMRAQWEEYVARRKARANSVWKLRSYHKIKWIWENLAPTHRPLPRKLLRAPFPPDRTLFLTFCLPRYSPWCDSIGQADREIAREGLMEAIMARSPDALRFIGLLYAMQVGSDITHIRAAVIDSGCDPKFLSQLMAMYMGSEEDLLDPQLWAWVENAQANGDAKGDWLQEGLKRKLATYNAVE